MISLVTAPYKPRYAKTLVYMLQNTDYRTIPYLRWYWRTQDFSKVERRRQLVLTKSAKLLLIVLRLGMLVQILLGLWLVYASQFQGLTAGWAFGLALIISYPIVWAHLVVVSLMLGRLFITKPKERWLVLRSEKVFAEHKGIKIAITGSYGKTSMKELLLSVLSEGRKTVATPANKNVPLSHAQLANNLNGDEDIIIIEYGEGGPGDVSRFARITHPTHAVITGVAAAHLDRYRTIDRAARDIFSVTRNLKSEKVFVNSQSPEAKKFIKPSFKTYDQFGALGWKVKDVTINIEGLAFVLIKGQRVMKLKSSLLGRHNLGPLSLVAAMADEFGLTEEQIIKGISLTKPFAHRMQPYRLNNAWIIDDTYNGNLEGIRAGTLLLKELKAKRKIYVTPGLVDQAEITVQIHQEMGKLIAGSEANLVVLMKNSVTEYIKQGLLSANFNGQLLIEPDPLAFYSNLNLFVAANDLVLMQNDWPDNYS